MQRWGERLAELVDARAPDEDIPDEVHLDWYGLADPELQHVLHSVFIQRLRNIAGGWSTSAGGVLGGAADDVARSLAIKEKVLDAIRIAKEVVEFRGTWFSRPDAQASRFDQLALESVRILIFEQLRMIRHSSNWS